MNRPFSADPHVAKRADLEALNARINALLPARYQGCFDRVQTVSMGSASLQYGSDGRVAWDEIWTSFCELALAGGPPHRGTWLAPGTSAEIAAEPDQYQQVVEELGRGIHLVTRLNVLPRRAPGWVGVVCQDERMAVWLVRAIVVENIHARHEDQLLLLPAGPHYQLAKEIKNVVTAVAKTCHYWTYHMPDAQRQAAARLPDELLAPCLPEQAAHAAEPLRLAMTAIEEGIECATELRRVASPYPGWVGLDCKSVEASVWLMRTVMVENILVRREDTVLYVPASPHFTATQVQRIVAAVVQAWRLWQWHGESHPEGAPESELD